MLHHVWRPATAVVGLAFAAGLAFGGAAQAESVQKECSVKYQAAKASNSLNGETWNQFYKQCAAELKGGGSAAAPAPTSAPALAPPPATTTTQAAPPSKKHHWWQGGASNSQAGTQSAPPPMSAGNVIFPERRFVAIFKPQTRPRAHGDLRRAISRQQGQWRQWRS